MTRPPGIGRFLAVVAVGGLLAGCSTGHPATGGRGAASPTTDHSAPTAGAPPSASTFTALPHSTGPGTSAAAAVDAWTTYQGRVHPARAWHLTADPLPLRGHKADALDGSAVYGQPLFADGRVIVATEDDDAATPWTRPTGAVCLEGGS